MGLKGPTGQEGDCGTRPSASPTLQIILSREEHGMCWNELECRRTLSGLKQAPSAAGSKAR